MKIILFVIIVLFITILSGSWIYHTYVLSKEIKNTPAPGEMIEVNGHDMHVYQEGEGKDTIVFMSGGGTSSPTLDFKPLWSILSEKHRIAVVEKAGYGWSDVADVPRDIDTLLEETRTALKHAGEEPPYILAAHSMSGLEAIYWAQHYPEEVKAIIGLDPAIPEAYSVMDIPPSFVQSTAAFAAQVGLLRFFPSVVNSSAVIESGLLSSKDEDTYRAIFNRRTLTANMREEVNQVKKNAEKVEAGMLPTETPIYFFISDGKEVGINNWNEMLSGYTEQFSNGKYLDMDVGHYVHAWEAELIAKEVGQFLMEINTQENE